MAYANISALFKGICDAIRAKDGSSGTIPHQDIPDRIAAMQTGAFEPHLWKKYTATNDWAVTETFVGSDSNGTKPTDVYGWHSVQSVNESGHFTVTSGILDGIAGVTQYSYLTGETTNAKHIYKRTGTSPTCKYYLLTVSNTKEMVKEEFVGYVCSGDVSEYPENGAQGDFYYETVSGWDKTLNLQSKTVTPTTTQQKVTFDTGYYGISEVIVNAAAAGKTVKTGEFLGPSYTEIAVETGFSTVDHFIAYKLPQDNGVYGVTKSGITMLTYVNGKMLRTGSSYGTYSCSIVYGEINFSVENGTITFTKESDSASQWFEASERYYWIAIGS